MGLMTTTLKFWLAERVGRLLSTGAGGLILLLIYLKSGTNITASATTIPVAFLLEIST